MPSVQIASALRPFSRAPGRASPLGTDLRTIQDYFGHRDPKHTAHYTRVAGDATRREFLEGAETCRQGAITCV